MYHWHRYNLERSRSVHCLKTEECFEIEIGDEEKVPQETIGRTGGGAYKLKLNKGWYLKAAISGAHEAEMFPRSSGYEGHWGNPCQQATFDNSYFQSMLYKSWKPLAAVNGNAAKNQWRRADKCFVNKQLDSFASTTCAAHEHQMMLDSDLCLAFSSTKEQQPWHAKAMGDCCAWTDLRLAYDLPDDPNGENRKDGDQLYCKKDEQGLGVCSPEYSHETPGAYSQSFLKI